RPTWAHSQNPRSHEPNLPESARIVDSPSQTKWVGQIPMGRNDDPDEDLWFRPVWEHEPDEKRSDDGPALSGLLSVPPARSDRRSGRMRPEDIVGLLGPLCAAQ